jgi:uncharacterized protein YndB with AHSA1/START domain
VSPTAAEAQRDGDELIATRRVAAAPTDVWRALTTPAHLAAFWGGHHATVPADSVTVELREGGAFALDTVGADGHGRRLEFVYEAVDEPTLLVFAEPRTGITTTVRLEPSGDETVVTIHQRRLPPELQTLQARDGLAAILDQLAAVAGQIARPSERTS